MMSMLKKMKLYNGALNEVLIGVSILFYNDVSKLTLLYLSDRLSCMLIEIIIKLKDVETKNKQEVKFVCIILLCILVIEKVCWLFYFKQHIVSNDIITYNTKLLLFITFIGNTIFDYY